MTGLLPSKLTLPCCLLRLPCAPMEWFPRPSLFSVITWNPDEKLQPVPASAATNKALYLKLKAIWEQGEGEASLLSPPPQSILWKPKGLAGWLLLSFSSEILWWQLVGALVGAMEEIGVEAKVAVVNVVLLLQTEGCLSRWAPPAACTRSPAQTSKGGGS